jgi:hypothetical protein
MRKMRQFRLADHFGARDHVQGIRLVHYGLLGQDETADRGDYQTNSYGNDGAG